MLASGRSEECSQKTPESSSPGSTNCQQGGLKQDTHTIDVTPGPSPGPSGFGNDGVQDI